MYTKKILFIFFLFVLKISSQEITLRGFVKDSLQNPLPYANVIAKPKETSKNLQFAITDDNGYYQLVLKKEEVV